MTISSAHTTYSTTLDNGATVTVPYYSSISNTGAVTGSISMPVTGAGLASSTGTITISNGGSGSSYTIGSGAGAFNWKIPEEFVDAFPDFDRVKQMCEEYPGLKIAYEKFVTTYKLVKDHYDTPEDERPLP